MTAKKKPSKPSSYMKKKKECEEWERCAYIWQEKFYDQKQISGELKERADNAEAELKLLLIHILQCEDTMQREWRTH